MTDHAFFGAPRRAPHVVPRVALQRRLEDGPMITTVSAGAGFGKTTLLSTWVSARPTAGVWIDASAAPGDRVSFWGNVFRVVSEARSSAGNGALRDAVIPHDGPLSDDSITATVSTFARSLSAPVVIVVDDAHLVDMDAVAPDLVALSRFAVGSRLVVADRRRRFRPGLFASDIDELRLSGDDLLLDVEETAAVVAAVRPRPRGRIDPEEAHRLAGGVVGLTRLVAVGGSAHPERLGADLLDPWVSGRRGGRGDAVDLGTPGTGPSSAHLVATLGTATGEEAALLSGMTPADAVALLDSAADHGLGRWREGAAADAFVFAPIVTRGAAAAVARTAAGAERRRVAARFAHVFAVRGDALTAFGLAIDAEDFDLAVAIGKRSFLQMVRDDTPGLLQRLRRVPLTRLRRHPLLVLFLAMLHAQSPRGRAAALFHFGVAEQLARATESTASPDDRALMVGVRSAAMRMQGRFDKAVPVAREFLDRFDHLTLEEQDRLSSLSRHLLWQAAHTLFFGGEAEAAAGAAERMLAVPVPADLVEDRGIRPALTTLAAVHATVGSMDLARDALAAAFEHPARAAAFYAVWERAAEALIHIEDGEFERAGRCLDDLDHPIGDGEYWPVDVVVRSLAEVAAGRIDDGLRLLERLLDADSPPRQAAATRDVVVALRALLSVVCRPAGTAAAVARNLSRSGPLAALVDAVIALRTGDPARTLVLTGPAVDERSASPRLRASSLLVRSAACVVVAQRDAAARAAREAIAVMEDAGLATPWMLLTGVERDTLLDLVGPEVATASLRERAGRMPLVHRSGTPVERLTARERDVLTRLVAGDTIPQVAEASGVSTNTVKTQRSRIYRKLGVDNRADAARVALEHDLI